MLYTPEDILRFGKYKRLTIRKVLDYDPSYIKWCLNNIDTFEMSDKDREEVFNLSYAHQQKLDEENLRDWGAMGDLY